MQNLLPDTPDIRIYQKLGRVDAKSLETVDQLLLILPASPSKADFGLLPQGAKMQDVYRKHAADGTPAFTTRLANSKQTLVVGGTIAADASTFEQLTLGRKLVAAATAQKAGCLGICAVGFSEEEQGQLVISVLAAALAGAFNMPAYKSKPDQAKIKNIRLLGIAEKIDTSRTEAEAKRNGKTLDTIVANFDNERNTLPGIKHSAWAAYNAVSEWADHDRTVRGKTLTDRADNRLNSVWFGAANKVKQEAFQSAMALVN